MPLAYTYEEPVITEEAGLFDTLPQLLNLYDNIVSFLKSHDIDHGNPVVLLVFGWVLRLALCYVVGDDASMAITAVLAVGAFFVYSKQRKVIKEELKNAKVAQEEIEKELKVAKKEKMTLMKRTLKNGGKPPPVSKSHRDQHPELYSVMDDVDGVIVPNRRAGKKKKLWNPKPKKSASGDFLKQKKTN